LAPGVSRSGITITAGLFLGMERAAAARFSFLLATPITLAAALFALRHLVGPRAESTEAGVFLAGLLSSAIVGFLTIGFLLLFAALADEVLERQSIEIDQRLLVALHAHANPALDQLALLVSLLGSEALAVLLVVSLGWLIRKRRYGAAGSLLIAVVGAQLLN